MPCFGCRFVRNIAKYTVYTWFFLMLFNVLKVLGTMNVGKTTFIFSIDNAVYNDDILA